jgi:hypothetical protein
MSYNYTNYTIILRGHIPLFLLDKYKEWCHTNISVNDWEWTGGHSYKDFRFWFRKQEDLLAFKLVFGLHDV